MKKKTIYEINKSTIDDLAAAVDAIISDLGRSAVIRDVYFSQDVEQGTLRTVYTNFQITVEGE